MELIITLSEDGRMDLKAPPLPLPMIVGILEIVKNSLMTMPMEEAPKIVPASVVPFPPRNLA